MSDEMVSHLQAEMEWQRERERIREAESIAKHKTYERERPKFYLAALLAWLGVLVVGVGAIVTASDNRGHQIVWGGVWLIAQAVATFVVWALRTADDPPRY